MVKPEERVDHMPHTQNYPVEDVLVDLLEVRAGLFTINSTAVNKAGVPCMCRIRVDSKEKKNGITPRPTLTAPDNQSHSTTATTGNSGRRPTKQTRPFRPKSSAFVDAGFAGLVHTCSSRNQGS